MNGRDREALSDILGVLDPVLGFPITNLQTLEETDYLHDALIHAYDRVDLEEVWGAYRQLRGLREQIAAMVDPPES